MLRLARRVFADGRARTLGFVYLFAAYAYIQPAAYRSAYNTIASRLAFARSFGPNTAIRMLYGEPRRLVSVSGYAAWRVGGTLAIFAAAWGLLAAVRSFRTEEESGRTEFLLAGPISRGTFMNANLVAFASGLALLWIAEFAGTALSGLPVGGSALMALATVSVAAVFVGVGALSSQLSGTRRGALSVAVGASAIAFILRVAGDTIAGAGWLRWLTPLGWAENMRPFTGAKPLVVILPLLSTMLLLVISSELAERRDLGSGLLPSRDQARMSLRAPRSVGGQALRSEWGSLVIWAFCTFGFSIVVGTMASSVGNGVVSKSLQQQIAKLGAGSISTPAGYLGVTLLVFIVAICVFACAQLGAARHEEETQRLETLLSLPASRLGWLGARLKLAAAAIVGLSLLSALGAWLGTVAMGSTVPAVKMLEAGINIVPIALLFLGVATFAYALVPRAAGAMSYGLLIVALLWQLVGEMLSVPRWLVNLTPFAHIGLAPAAPVRVGAAAVMVVTALALICVGAFEFRRRDLVAA